MRKERYIYIYIYIFEREREEREREREREREIDRETEAERQRDGETESDRRTLQHPVAFDAEFRPDIGLRRNHFLSTHMSPFAAHHYVISTGRQDVT